MNTEINRYESREGYRPWTQDEVPVGGVIGVWSRDINNNKDVFIGKCLILGTWKMWYDREDFEIILGFCGAHENPKSVSSKNILNIGNYEYRVYNPWNFISPQKEVSDWSLCGTKIEKILNRDPKKVKKEVKKETKSKSKDSNVSKSKKQCMCKENCYASADLRIDLLTNHTSTCPYVTRGMILDKSIELFKELTEGIEDWAADEDGVHPAVWEAYKRAKYILGEGNSIGKEND